MLKFLAALSLALLLNTKTAGAQLIDVDQPSNTQVIAHFFQGDIAQSFVPNKPTSVGAGFYMNASFGVGGTFTVELWDNLPNLTGANMLATGSVSAIPDTWAEVTWPSAPLIVGNTYYLVLTCTDSAMGVAGDILNPYTQGMVFANTGFTPFPTLDFTFHTWADGIPLALSITGSCPTSVTITVVGATPSGSIALAYGGSTGTFTLPPGTCGGLVLGMNNPTLAGFFNADATGTLSLTTPIPSGICGRTLQAVDLSACVATNTVIL